MAALLELVRAVRVDGAMLPPAPEAERVLRAVHRILAGTPLCAWSTVTTDAKAHVNIGYFAYSDDLHLYLLSHPASRHCRNVAANPSMSVAVYASAQNWTDPGRGVQLFGTCNEVAVEDASDAERIYAARYPAFRPWSAALKAGDLAREYHFYRFAVDRMKLLDEAEFGDGVFIVADVIRG